MLSKRPPDAFKSPLGHPSQLLYPPLMLFLEPSCRIAHTSTLLTFKVLLHFLVPLLQPHTVFLNRAILLWWGLDCPVTDATVSKILFKEGMVAVIGVVQAQDGRKRVTSEKQRLVSRDGS